MVQVSLSTSTDFAPNPNAVVEDQGTLLTFRFDLDEAAPTGGLRVYLEGDLTSNLSRLDLNSIFLAVHLVKMSIYLVLREILTLLG